MILKLFLIVVCTLFVNAYTNDQEPPIAHPYPFLVSLHKHSNNKIFKYCAGVIVSKSWVLTNAHCADEDRIKINEIIVHAGVPKTYNFDYKFSQVRKVIKIIRHHKYRHLGGGIAKYDLVMLKVNKPFVQGWNVQVVKLSTSRNIVGTGEIVSWGDSSGHGNGKQSSSLLYASLDVVDKEKCLQYYSDIWDKFCVGNPTKGACSGDAGAPFIKYDENTGTGIVAGLASASSIPCTSKPALYTNVGFFIHFILNTIHNE